ncbi:ATP-dependent helicase [Xylanibacillus composti]|uniref:DEAD/DEAH box family ATP-dependent RNA helicase n=1 Tax=Xylanibacillus composti TaxID=1572762 RepID=A0A8J4M2F3_9BACL|nr:DEAD/DEAH box helicase [Xylanibacillus composti]MDT9723482.1 ATP-dependent helicase [Xylanibacillus composti]GIQ68481.1 DEAD/DEAH box family ATP-dependent RNA helicase [Xylanibacillus composti]
MMREFAQMTIHEAMAAKLDEQQIKEPTQIQRLAMQPILEGRSLTAQSATGTGKTLAYVLPVLQRMEADTDKLQAVVVAPSQELAMQIADVFQTYGSLLRVRVQSAIGGASIQRQLDKLKEKPHVLVGTPGRLEELSGTRKLKWHEVRTIVLDEADQLIKLGEIAKLDKLISRAPRDRQLLLFSATITPEIKEAAVKWMADPMHIEASEEDGGRQTRVEHLSIVSEERDKIDTLRKAIRHLSVRSAMIFVQETARIREVAEKLAYHGLPAEMLYGEAGSRERAEAMRRFRSARTQLLVTTDVASRGLDIPRLSHVIMFDPPTDADQYVHRAGRTGRMGREGTVVLLLTPRQSFLADKFSKALGIPIRPKRIERGAIVETEAGTAQPKRERNRTGDAAVPAAQRKAQAKPAVPAKDKDKAASRQRAKKNKGAPRWLKEKQSREKS